MSNGDLLGSSELSARNRAQIVLQVFYPVWYLAFRFSLLVCLVYFGLEVIFLFHLLYALNLLAFVFRAIHINAHLVVAEMYIYMYAYI